MKKLVPVLKTVDLDKKFSETNYPILVNNLPMKTKDERAKFNSLIITTYDLTDVLSTIPSCTCGALTGGWHLGKICVECSTKVERASEETIEEKLWMMCPPEVNGFIHPRVWIALTELLGKRNFNVLHWLIDSRVEVPHNVSDTVKKKVALFNSYNFPRGLNNFIANYDLFLEILTKIKPKGIAPDKLAWLQSIKHISFPKYLPLPVKALLVLENTHLGSYSEIFNEDALSAARTISGLSILNRITTPSQQVIENKIAAALISYCDFYMKCAVSNLNGKTGLLRGQYLKSKSNFTLRSVITSITVPHKYNEIHIPYATGIELFKIHIISALLKLGFNEKEAWDRVDLAGLKFDPLLHKLATEAIALENINGGSTLYQRNPTLRRLSIQNLFISKIKEDIYDKTTSLSVLVLKFFNADFDGDEMNLTLMLGRKMQKRATMFSPHYGIHSMLNPGKLDDAIAKPDVTLSTLCAWVNGYINN